MTVTLGLPRMSIRMDPAERRVPNQPWRWRCLDVGDTWHFHVDDTGTYATHLEAAAAAKTHAQLHEAMDRWAGEHADEVALRGQVRQLEHLVADLQDELDARRREGAA